MCSQRPREHIAGASPLSLVLIIFFKLQGDGGSSQKEVPIFSLALASNRNP